MKKSKTSLVYAISLGLLLVLVGLGIFIPGPFQTFTEHLHGKITTNFGWFYLLLVTGILFFCFYLIVRNICLVDKSMV